MINISRVADVVRHILEIDERSRNSDSYLYLKVADWYSEGSVNLPFSYVLMNKKELGIPKFETVRRSRQKIQSECEWLRATEKVEEGRFQNYKEVKKFALS